MKLLIITFIAVLRARAARAQMKHEHMGITTCSDTEREDLNGNDGEERMYADFVKKEAVDMLPPFADPIEFPGYYEAAEGDMGVCKANLETLIKDYKDEPIPSAPPQSSLYSKDDAQPGSKNTLICHSARFFPPPIRVSWTKNGVDVSDRAALSQYYPNKDNTYNQFSHLPFTPQDGDVYTCTVNHKALQGPDTKTWDVELESERSSVGASVFCGVGLFVGLVGVATGTFFLIKGNKCN